MGKKKAVAKTRFSLDLDEADYKALCAEWVKRRDGGQRTTMRAIIVEAIRAHVPSPATRAT